MSARRMLLPLAAVALAAMALAGCASVGAKPWERGTLARPDMQLETDAVQSAFDDHVYFSKEASSGGRAFGGGGCGCN